MTTLAISPWRRWARWRRRRGLANLGPPVKVLSFVALLVALDQATKAQLTTEAWAWHQQPRTWLIQPLITLLVALPFLLSPLTRRAATFAVAGVIGNGLSALRFDVVANPIQVRTETHAVAFNLADVFLILGFAFAAFAVAAHTVHLLTTRRHPA